MDVLVYWRPQIELTAFEQGPVSEGTWRAFLQLVELCHCVEHWREEVRDARSKKPIRSLYPESNYMRNKRRREWKREIEQHEAHMHRAAYLADQPPQDATNPDWKILNACALDTITRDIALSPLPHSLQKRSLLLMSLRKSPAVGSQGLGTRKTRL